MIIQSIGEVHCSHSGAFLFCILPDFDSLSPDSLQLLLFLPSKRPHALETGTAVPGSQSHLRVKGWEDSQEAPKILEARSDWPWGNARYTHIQFRQRDYTSCSCPGVYSNVTTVSFCWLLLVCSVLYQCIISFCLIQPQLIVVLV